MKIFAIQKTQTNTYAPKFKQNDSGTTKTNPAGDTFVSSKVSFGMATKIQMEADIARLENQLTKQLTTKARKSIQDQLDNLRIDLELLYGGNKVSGTWDPAAHAAEHPFD